ncbi:hypothetical protein LXJ56_28265, partial [Escherichia coli]|nr:hypothetical protein [Escherichia coli]
TTPATPLAEAERLDADGRPAEALPLYRQTRDQASDPALRRRLALRIAIADAMRRPDTLVAFAKGKPPAEVRPIADVLALLGRPKAAFDLAGPGGTIADQLARTQWALAAGDAAGARTAAAQAVAAAGTADDKRYALAL